MKRTKVINRSLYIHLKRTFTKAYARNFRIHSNPKTKFLLNSNFDNVLQKLIYTATIEGEFDLIRGC